MYCAVSNYEIDNLAFDNLEPWPSTQLLLHVTPI
jgi:hypothetical protein